MGYAPSTIQRIWRAFCLQPHRSKTLKPSDDKLFVEKVRDVIGLYLAPPERAQFHEARRDALAHYQAEIDNLAVALEDVNDPTLPETDGDPPGIELVADFL